MNFAIGDVVTLVSGGDPMSVVAVNGDLVTCCWFESLPEGGWKGVNRATFPSAVLQDYPAAGSATDREVH